MRLRLVKIHMPLLRGAPVRAQLWMEQGVVCPGTTGTIAHLPAIGHCSCPSEPGRVPHDTLADAPVFRADVAYSLGALSLAALPAGMPSRAGV